MPSREGSNLRPLWRIRHTLNRQKVKYGGRSTEKMLICNARSRNVYENKQNVDIMPGEKSNIYVEVKRFLQETTNSHGQFAVNQCCPKKVGALRRNCMIETK